MSNGAQCVQRAAERCLLRRGIAMCTFAFQYCAVLAQVQVLESLRMQQICRLRDVLREEDTETI